MSITVKVEKILTEDEWYFLKFPIQDERGNQADSEGPGYFDDNLDDWIKFWYSKGYRFVKLDSSEENKNG